MSFGERRNLFRVVNDTLRAELPAALAKYPVKQVANDAHCSERTVENWRSGTVIISATRLFALAALYPEVRALVRRLTLAEQGDGEHPQQVLDQIAKLIGARR